MFKFLDRLRQESDLKKRNFALVVSLSVTLVIFIFWALSFFQDLNQKGTFEKDNIASPFEAITKQIKELFDTKTVYDLE